MLKIEHELILKAVLVNKSSLEVDCISDMLEKDLDWCEIAGQLINHRLLGYFYKGLNEEQCKKLPKELRRMLKLITWAQAKQQREKIEEFKLVSEKIEASNVNFAGLKGLIFCADFYDLSDRRSNDLDLLVLESDLQELDDVMRKLGYIQSFMPNGEMKEASKKEKMIQRLKYHDLVPYVKQCKDQIIEFDINFLFDTNSNLIDKEIFEYGTKIYKGKEYSVRGLVFDTNLLHLCIHFSREATNSLWTEGRRDVVLYKIVDIINYIRAHENEFDIKKWCDLAIKFNLEKKCYFTFKILNEFYQNNKIDKVLELLKQEDDEFMKEIVVEGKKQTIYRQESFREKAFNLVQ